MSEINDDQIEGERELLSLYFGKNQEVFLDIYDKYLDGRSPFKFNITAMFFP